MVMYEERAYTGVEKTRVIRPPPSARLRVKSRTIPSHIENEDFM